MTKLLCTSCKIKKNLDQFYGDKRYPKRHFKSYECKECYKRRKNKPKEWIHCKFCNNSFQGYVAKDKFCSKTCSNKYGYWKQTKSGYFKTEAYLEKARAKNIKITITNKVLKKGASNNNKRWGEEEEKKLVKKRGGKYVYTAKELALEFGRTLKSVQLKRWRKDK